ncbi:MAG TPA: methylmalonyl-CoA mutase [Ignisphaera aggregans]|uniref:Methylmalonyl-CoA mutase n=1 Tax=Ignisphaera aggregans TaxID=334771 RepID=A0A832YZS2_9CREN|nr:methylmalonyl-CoA mutase [Ignisphaera aggregans]
MWDPKEIEKIREKLMEWEKEVVEPILKKMPERKREFLTEQGFVVKRLYTPVDLAELGWNYLEKLGFPGQYPFTRGIYPTMYRGRPWTIRQYSGYGSAEETNKRYRYLLSIGQTGLSMAFDLPTQLGLDPDHPLAYYEVGKVGVACPTPVEMDIVFKDIPMDKITTSMTINATAMEILSMYILVAESRGIPRHVLGGTVQNDILKEFIARNNYIYPPLPSMRYATDLIIWAAKEMPKWNSISISGYHFEEAGATPAQEIAFTLADGIEYVRWVLERGKAQGWPKSVDDFAPRLSFFFAARTNLFEQVAKFRAARRMWAKIMKEWFGAKNPRSMMLRFHTQTAGVQLTAQQPLVNLIRTTIQALAAILGGTQSLHVNSYDEALSLPTEEAVKLSIRVQQVILYESGVVDTVDPLGGAYYVEWLTDMLENEAWKLIEKIEGMGGMLKAIELGWPQAEIARAAYEYQLRVERGEIPIVGVNIFVEQEMPRIKVLKVDPAVRERVIARLNEYRKSRDMVKVERALNELRRVAEREDVNLMPYILEAVRAGATLGEISGALREVWGEWRAPEVI